MTVDLALRFYEMYNLHDTALLDGLLAPEYVGTVNGQAVRGVDGAKALIGAFLSAFPDVVYQVEDTVAQGDRVVTRWSATATHGGAFAGVEATGKRVTMLGITIFRVGGGWIHELWNVWDVAGLVRQIRE